MLLSILFHTQIGYYGQFLILRWQLRREARAAWLASLPDARLEAFSLEAVNTSGKWEEEGKEFSWHDQMYDVIRQKTIEGKTWLYCLDDERETNLIQQSNDITSISQDKWQHTPAQKDGRLSFFKMDITLLPGTEDIRMRGARLIQQFYALATPVPPYHVQEIPVPPPEHKA